MKNWMLVLLSLALCMGCGAKTSAPPTFSTLLIRSPYANDKFKIHHNIANSATIKSFHVVVQSAEKLQQPCQCAPLYRVELQEPSGISHTYDFVPYDKAEGHLRFWHQDDMYALMPEQMKSWCKKANVSFEKYFVILPNKANPADREGAAADL